ncbi:hypothetical protein [Corynebacterium heidelbergense]|uniref:hypothetical protein n=1 Tax=Corynebacterium heidelbergense TaxID=2055947 RepID=UPI0014029975|nr:hypothetical protein [Corynebacterium heidelbergense]
MLQAPVRKASRTSLRTSGRVYVARMIYDVLLIAATCVAFALMQFAVKAVDKL